MRRTWSKIKLLKDHGGAMDSQTQNATVAPCILSSESHG